MKTTDLKSTLNLPRTDFPMQAGLQRAEPALLERWKKENLYQQLRQARANAPLFVYHDGPPYANGEVHPGTALNKILKDFVVRSKNMAGFNAAFIPGWDCHGLPIEINVDKELGARKAQMPPLEIRRACRAYAERFVELHRQVFIRLGCLGEWENPYLTMSNSYEFTIADAFLTFLEKGYVYKGLKPVLWCWRDQTALAEAEIEYEMRTSPSIWVRYAVVGDPVAVGPKDFPANTHAVIWTTTPWTLPASLALAFHPQLRYTVIEAGSGRYLIAEDLVDRFGKDTGPDPSGRVAKQLGSWTGDQLTTLKFQHPFLDRVIPTVLADYVTLEQGTGVVHTAPGHGAEDFATGQKYGLEIYCPVDNAGRFTEGLDAYNGQQIFDANPRIIALLKERGALVAEGTIEHSYPHCWRCHQPLIFRATEQWFISLEHAQLRRQALEAVKKVEWVPPWGEEQMTAMLETRPDWCISRQRVWGVPIPVFYCDACGEKFTDVPTLRTAVRWFQREGADAWYKYDASDLLPQGTRCASCNGTGFRKETDILDVWFDSGSSHLAVLGHRKDAPWPADLYFEGLDQYRGWFHSSLLVALGVKGAPPYRTVLTHAWVLDAEGRPMSKSLGNYVAASELIEKYGAEIFRLLASSVDYRGDVRMGPALFDQSAEAYRKIRNTFRYCLSNLSGFDPARDALPSEKLEELDRWMLGRTAELAARCRAAYDRYEFFKVYHALYSFCTVDLSAVYFDILKDRLYISHPSSPARRSAQTAICRIADTLVRLAAPFLVFTTEEVWQHLPAATKRAASVHLTEFLQPKEIDAGLSAEKAARWGKLFEVRGEVLKALERARQAKTIRGSLDAQVILRADGEWSALLHDYKDQLRALFIVSAVDLSRDSVPEVQPSDLPGLAIGVRAADGAKCARCWNYSPRVGTFSIHPSVCERCAPVLEELLAGSNR